jgi:hypothetical protein
MSTEPQNTGQPPRHTDVSFEERDIQASTIYGYLLALAAATVAAMVICVFILRFTTEHAVSVETPPPPSREVLGKDHRSFPPEPMLQGVPGHETDPQQDLRNKMKADAEANEKFDWIDKNSSVAQIPVKDAMRVIAEKGLPGAPASQAEKKK